MRGQQSSPIQGIFASLSLSRNASVTVKCPRFGRDNDDILAMGPHTPSKGERGELYART